MAVKTIKKSDCLANISFADGFNIDSIWLHGGNTQLRRQRNTPHVLTRGDRLEVPERESGEETASTEQRHRFRRLNKVVKLRLRLLKAGDPLADETYQLEIDGRLIEGRTDGDGLLEETIPPLAKTATLNLDNDEYQLEIGDLDPVSELPGVQARLNNLGFPCGEVDGIMGPKTRDALLLFQETYELEMSGDADDETRAKLEELHGS